MNTNQKSKGTVWMLCSLTMCRRGTGTLIGPSSQGGRTLTRRQQSDPPYTGVNNETTMCVTSACMCTQPGRQCPHQLLIRQVMVKGLNNFHCEGLSATFGHGWGRCIWMLSWSRWILKWFHGLNFYHLTQGGQVPLDQPAWNMLNGWKMKCAG